MNMMNVAQISRVDLNLLVLFQTVLEEGHVGRAADRLSLTPSAVSHGLGRLRKLLNDPLFLRTPKGVVPTDRALALAEPVADVLARIQGVFNSAAPFDPGVSRRRFVIGAPDALLASTMMPLLAGIRAKAPLIDIGLVHLMPGRRRGANDHPWAESLEKLERRELDVALLPTQTLPPRFAVRALFMEDFVVAMQKAHALAKTPTLSTFCAAEHVLVSTSGDPYGFVDELLAQRGLVRRIVLTVPTFMMALTQVSSSDLVAVLPRSLVERYADTFGLTCIELPVERAPEPIAAVATAASTKDEGIAWLIEALAGECASSA